VKKQKEYRKTHWTEQGRVEKATKKDNLSRGSATIAPEKPQKTGGGEGVT